MKLTLRAALAAVAFASACTPALAQTAFPSPGGGMVDGKVLMCLSGGKAVPCTASGGTLAVSGTFSASFAGFTPTPAYSQLTVGATSTRVALPSGEVVIVYNTGANPASVTLGDTGVVATGANDIIQPNSWIAFTVGSFADLAGIEATGASGGTTLVISGGSGLPTGAGGGGSGGGGGSNASVGTTGSTAPGSATQIGGVDASGNLTAPIITATQALKVANSDTQSVAGTASGGNAANTIQGNASGIPVPMSAASLPLPTGAATAANQEVTTAGTSATSAQAVQGVTGGVAMPVTPKTGTFTIAGCTVGTSSAQCLAGGTYNHVQIQNTSASASIACHWGGTAALNSASSVQLAAGQPALWGPATSGVPASTALNCIASAANTPLYVESN